MSSHPNIQIAGARYSGVAAVPLHEPSQTRRETKRPTRRTVRTYRVEESQRSSSEDQPSTTAQEEARHAARTSRRSQAHASSTRSRRARQADDEKVSRTESGAAVSDTPRVSARKVSAGEAVDRIRAFLTDNPRRTRVLVALAIVAALAFVVYPPVRDLYVAMRTRDDLTVQYEALTETNEELMHDISQLQTAEGIEDEARRRGYVYEGETSVVVEGLPQEDETGSGVVAVSGEKVEDTRPWYQRALDAFFFYTPEGV